MRQRQVLPILSVIAVVLIAVSTPAIRAPAESKSAAEPAHPRLYFTAADLPRLRQLRGSGQHAVIWRNLQTSADWCLTLKPRQAWIAPVTSDPLHENLYDRFFAIMGDLAVTEHLAFAYAYSGDERYGEAASKWVLASCRAWKREADGQPDPSKAYAVTRLLKGVAVGYDLVHDRFTAAERQEVLQALVGISQKYYKGYFLTPEIAGPDFHTHHAIVEWASFGVVALALLGEAPEAKDWLEATEKKFEEHLLPMGLADDGAQTEGATFWASTLQYRLFFLDPLRRVTGRDLFSKHKKHMNADLALATIAAEQVAEHDYDHQTVVLEPSYGQLNYYAPVLLYLAREYRQPHYHYLALWDHSLGRMQQTRYITPHGERMLFELGGYAYAWYDPGVPARAQEKRLSYRFDSVDEAYLRASWQPNDLLAGVRHGELVVHAGGQPVFIEPLAWQEPPQPLRVQALEDDGTRALLRCTGRDGQSLTIELHRPGRLVIRRRGVKEWQWWCQGKPVRTGNEVAWDKDVYLTVRAGTLSAWEPDGYAPKLAVGNGKLRLADPVPKTFPRATIAAPSEGEIVVEIQKK